MNTTLNKIAKPFLILNQQRSVTQKLAGLFGKSSFVEMWPLQEKASSAPELTFAGSGNVNFASGASLDNLAAGNFTAELWCLVPSYVNGGLILSKTDNVGANGWGIYTSGGNTIRFRVNHDGTIANSDSSEALGNYMHIVGMYTAATKESRVAVNGIWGSSAINTGNYVSDASQSAYIQNPFGTALASGFKVGWVRISNSLRYTSGTTFTPPARETIPTVDANTVALWPMNEGYGTVAGDIGTNNNDGTITNGSWTTYPSAVGVINGYNGTYTGAKLADVAGRVPGSVAPYFDGVNDYVNVYSASLASAFNGDEGSLIINWLPNSGAWTDGIARRLAVFQDTAGNNWITITKGNSNNSMTFERRANATTKSVALNYSSYSWGCFALTYSLSSDYGRPYINGVIGASTMSGLSAFTSNIVSGRALIGAGSTVPALATRGWEQYAILLNRAATSAEIEKANKILGGS